MKKTKTVLMMIAAMLLTCSVLVAQTPQAIPYQGVARNGSGNIIGSQNISLQFSIHDGTPTGTVVYKETHSATTGTLGLFNVNIGQGTIVTGTLGGVPWGTGAKYLQVEMDPAGGTSYINMGTTQLMSVPYALFAGQSSDLPAGTATGNTLRWNGTAWVADNALFNDGTNAGIGTNAPSSKLHVKGSADNTQLIIDANATQSNTNPLFKLRSSSGADLLWIHSDDPFNTFTGLNAGRVNNAAGGGLYNSFFGAYAGYSNTTGYQNTASGVAALYNTTIGSNNTASGFYALFYNTTGGSNTVSGLQALYSNTTGDNNTANGVNALNSNTTGSSNTGLGYNANVSSGSLTNATAIGANAIVSQSNSLVLGSGANVGIGISSPSSMLHVKGSADNTQLIIDANATQSNTNPLFKLRSSSGTDLLWIHSDDPFNTFTGLNAGRVNNAAGGGTSNSFFGSNAGYSNTTGNSNTASGSYALYYNTTGNSNTASGVLALPTNTTGSQNTASGVQALYNNSTGSQNTASGVQALYSNTTGYYNNATGYQALFLNTSGNSNTANGVQALFYNTTGNSNTANGTSALYYNTTGSFNTANGNAALILNTTGNFNTAIGMQTLLNNYTGTNNTALGYAADVGNVALTNATAIGNGASVNASNKVRIGNTAVTVIEGQVAFTTSDARFKTNVKQNVTGLDFIMKLKPVSYNFQYSKFSEFLGEKSVDKEVLTRKEALTEIGFLAQDVEAVCKESGINASNLFHAPDNDKDNYSIAYGQLVVPLVKAVQEQQQTIGNQQLAIDNLKEENKNLQKQMDELKAMIRK